MLSKLSDSELIDSLKAVRRNEKEVLVVVLKHLAEMESRKLYAHLGYPSLHAYCVSELGYDDGSANRRVMASRAYIVAPSQIEKSLESGAVSLTTLAQAQRHIQRQSYVHHAPLDQSAKVEIFKAIEHKSIEETQRYFVTADPSLSQKTAERLRPVSEELTEVKFTLTKDQLKKFNRIRDLYFHKNPNPSLNEIMEWMISVTLEHKDPMEKKQRVKKAAPQVEQPELPDLNTHLPPSVASSGNPRTIAPSLRVSVFKRDQGKCQFVSTQSGKKCASTRGLQLDHKTPVALNGQATLENLQLLCFKHNAVKGARPSG